MGGMAKKSKDLPKNETFVAYNHVNGQALLVDKNAGTAAPIDTSLPEGKDSLKNASGRYRTEVKQECHRLYMAGVSLKEIHRRTGVPISALENWAYAKHALDRYEELAWNHSRKLMMQEAKEINIQKYAIVEKKALKRVDEYLERAHIETPEDFQKIAGGIASLSKALQGTTKAPAEKAQTAVTVNVNPLTPAEARRILENDPIKRIAEAQTREEANQVLVDAEVVERDE